MNKLFAFGVVFAVALSAQASYLKWQVGEDAGDDLDAVAEYKDWTEAKVVAFSKTDRSDATEVDSLRNWGGNVAGPDIVELGSDIGMGYSFYIELLNGSEVVGYSKSTFTYTSLVTDGYIVTDYVDPMTITTAQAWHAGEYKATPEPTSAMLMLLGVAGLALRRKQRKLA